MLISKRATRRPRGRWLAAATAITVTASLAACSGGTATATKSFNLDCAKGIPAASAAATAAAATAQSKGLQFVTSHEALVKCAESIGGTIVVQSTDTDPSPYVSAFEKAYPQLKVKAVSFDGTESRQRFLIEAQSGHSEQYDVGYAAPEDYDTLTGYMKTFDILGMAQQKVLNIPPQMIDPDNRAIVATSSTVIAYAYNPKMISGADLPTSWNDFTNPKFSSAKLGEAVDITFKNEAVNTQFLGPDAMTAYATGIAKNKPLWVTSYNNGLQAVADGEVAVFPYIDLHSANRMLKKSPNVNMKVGFISPVPVRTSDTYGVLNSTFSKNPYAALLYIEWLCSPDAQALKDADASPQGSIYADPAAKQAVGSLPLDVSSFQSLTQDADWGSALIKAAGFPQAKSGS
jgi:ABC-type Fe3+ transport system substrate-binding protein